MMFYLFVHVKNRSIYKDGIGHPNVNMADDYTFYLALFFKFNFFGLFLFSLNKSRSVPYCLKESFAKKAW